MDDKPYQIICDGCGDEYECYQFWFFEHDGRRYQGHEWCMDKLHRKLDPLWGVPPKTATVTEKRYLALLRIADLAKRFFHHQDDSVISAINDALEEV